MVRRFLLLSYQSPWFAWAACVSMATVPLGCAVPMACSHPGPWPTAPCLHCLMVPQGCQCVFTSHCSPSPRQAGKIQLLAGRRCDWLEQTKRRREGERERDDIVDSNYAVSMLRVAFTQQRLITHQTQHQHGERKALSGFLWKGKFTQIAHKRTKRNRSKKENIHPFQQNPSGFFFFF